MRALKVELADVERENADSRRQIQTLRAEVARLRDDPQAVERIARDQLGFVRKSEVVVHFTSPR
jgi:cell division protein FtsB